VWQDTVYKTFPWPRFLGKATWRLVFGDMSVREIDGYQPLKGWGIGDVLSSLSGLLSRVMDVAMIIDTSEEKE
jgi:hypothetical protein